MPPALASPTVTRQSAVLSGIEHKHRLGEDDPALSLVVVGMSAGGLAPLRQMLSAMPTGFPGAVVVAQHLAPCGEGSPNWLPSLRKHRAVTAATGMTLREGVVYFCPAQRHIVVNPDATLTVSSKRHMNFVRPSIDWLFETAAATYRERTLGVLLSGANGDGARGSRYIGGEGGLVLVQDPQTCQSPEMPTAAIRSGFVHSWHAPSEIAPLLMARMESVQRRWRRAWVDPFGAEVVIDQAISYAAAE